MSKPSPKFYVVWRGAEPGIYTSWADCERQVKGFDGAVFKAFRTEAEAREAYASSPADYVRRQPATPARTPAGQPANPPSWRNDTVLPLPPAVEADALAVDAACSGNPGPMEYRGICLKTGQEVFHYGPIQGTNNIGEFLAIVHALALLRQQGLRKTIYSDSRNALLWVKQKQCRTRLQRTPKTEKAFQLIERAEKWLRENTTDCPLLKWETEQWGEVPADFGRK